MTRTLLNQSTQINPSKTFEDTNSPGATMESAAASLQDDLNNLRSQTHRILDATLGGNWYDDAPTVNAKKRGLTQLNADLDDIEIKPFLFRTQVLTDVAVPATQNFVVLSVAGSETPTVTASVGAVDTEGAKVAYSATFPAHSLDEIAGANALSPYNLCSVMDSTTRQPIQSAGRDVYGLLQSESNVDGHTFNDTDQQVMISFVRVNATGDDLEACPVADIESTTINYGYVAQLEFDNVPRHAWLSGILADQVASVDVTLDNAIDNQSGPATQAQDIEWRISDTFTLDFQDSTGAVNILRIAPNAAGDELEINADDLDVNLANDADFSQGAKFDTSGTEIDIGVTAGAIETTGAADLMVRGAGELYLDDGNQTGSTWTQDGIKLSDTTAEWDDFETAYGEVSLLNAMVQAQSAAATDKEQAVVTAATITAGTNVTGAGGSPNIDTQLLDYSSIAFVTDVDVYVNGELMRNAAGATEDVYPGDSQANGDLKFTFALQGSPGNPDTITMRVYGA